MAPVLSRTQWELFEGHLNEAAFLLLQWEHALLSPAFTLAGLAVGLEERLLAHVDALVLGGAPVAEALLRPGLEDADMAILKAAALALLSRGDETDELRVLDCFANSTEETRPGLRRALELRSSPRCMQLLKKLLESPEPGVQAAALEVLASLKADPGPTLGALLAHSVPEVQVAALKAVRVGSEPVDMRAIREAVESRHSSLRDEALVTAIIVGMDSAWSICRRLATDNPAENGIALLLLGLGGDDADLRWLLEKSEDLRVGGHAIWAQGFGGRIESAERCVTLLAHETLGKWAAEAFCAITGLRLEAHQVMAPPEATRDEAARHPRPEDALPLAVPSEVQQWWSEHRNRFRPGVRYFMGRPLTPSWLVEACELMPARRSHVLAQELALRSRGNILLPTLAFSDRRRAELQAAKEILERMPLSRPIQELTAVARYVPRRTPSDACASQPRSKQSSRVLTGRLTVTGLGMVSAIGDGVVTSCAASRAGMLRVTPLEEVSVWDSGDKRLEPTRGHHIPWVTEGFSGLGRLAALATQALLDLLEQARFDKECRYALYLSAPSDFYRLHQDERDGLSQRHALRRAEYRQRLLTTILAAVGLPVIPKVQVLHFGELGFIEALQDATRQLDTGAVDACIIGGVDSLVEPQVVDALDELGLLKTPENPVGVLPGEASAFVLVERGEVALRRGARPLAVLDAACMQAEPFHRLSNTPSQGRALARCAGEALSRGQDCGERIRLVIAALNGDAYRASDWGHALVRLRTDKLLNQAIEWYPAASFGEIGAATGPAGVCMAVRGFQRGYSPEGDALLWVSGDDGGRGSLLLSRP
ncbi:TIGR02270 family protein [Pyxidicoccus parkwayensis]|uniref:TIGR02270 family protein n=1 Tax=Pyxidicoccus parkwayensis TaxID=2813578 RepID=A0ABX7P835_9BACT|nr:TIGR02270 family protein [Pyxidicoccus parkwaysis]QSQ26650.1 TIGR02270 family protein [Pyxidicoccus parkwaysis]